MKAFAWASLALVISAADAYAHAMPRAESPTPNSVLIKSPSAITMRFSETVVAAFSGFELDNASGQALGLGSAAVDPNDSAVLTAPVTEKLAPGTYTVRWHAVSTDTHRSSGQYSFRVKG